MYDLDRVARLIAERKPWHSMPQAFYTDPEIFDLDLDAIFGRHWMMVGFECELDRPGAYLSAMIGKTPVLILRNKRDEIVGFHNSCRHRGAQICPVGSGRVPRLVCPYHQWSYDLDGKLLRAQRMGSDFDPAQHNLRPIHVEIVAGCIYACIGDEAPDFSAFKSAVEPALAPHNLRDAKVAHVVVLDEDANWKLVMENGRECHHCATCHPELKITFPVSIADGNTFHDGQIETPFMARMREVGLGQAYAESDWWQVGRFPFNDGVKSYSMDGASLVSKNLTDLNDGDVGSLRWAIEPNNFCHATGDNAVMVNIEPIAPLKTRVTTKWLVHKDAIEGVDYDIDRLIHVWDQTNRQDRDLAENNQRGVSGQGYTPGPYSPEAEGFVNSFVEWYLSGLYSFVKSGAR